MALDFRLLLRQFFSPFGRFHRDGEKAYIKLQNWRKERENGSFIRGAGSPRNSGAIFYFLAPPFPQISFFVGSAFSRQKFVPISSGGLWKLYQGDKITAFSVSSLPRFLFFLIGKKVNDRRSERRAVFPPAVRGGPEISPPFFYRRKKIFAFSHRMFRIVNFPMDPSFLLSSVCR